MNVCLCCQSHNKNRLCCGLRAIDPHRAVGILPARSEAPIATCMQPRRKTLSPPDSRLHPLVALSHQGCQEINENAAKCRENSAAVLRGSPCAGCRSPVGHECIYNFMHAHFQIDFSLMPGSGFIMEWPFKL